VRNMVDLAQGVRAQIIKETAPKSAATKSFTMQRLRYAALWGACAAGALLIAVLSSRGEVGTQRLAGVPRGGNAQVATARTDTAPVETERLAEAVRGLAADDERVKARLAAVEHNLDDVTGSVSKQIEAVGAARRAEDGPTITGTATASVALLSVPTPPLPPIAAPAAIQAPPDPVAPAAPEMAYGVDIGSGLTIQALRLRWLAMRSAHPQLFEGLQPIISVREVAHANRVELRLVAGPFAEANTAEQLCTALAQFGLFCQPTMFDGQRLALR